MKKGNRRRRKNKRRAIKRLTRILVVIFLLLCLCLCLCLLLRKGNPSEEGIEYLKNGQYEEAIKQFEQAVEDEVNVGDAYRGIGIARWETENYEGARDAFQKALDADTESPFTGIIYNFLGSCELKLGNPESAQNYFQLGIGLKGNSAKLDQEMKYNQIVAFEQLGDWESAKARLAEYVAEYPEDANALKEQQFLETR
ncbi:tetratricopeptide repeat protein [Sporofaciens musculi]|uniref:tetratricopeptide repeat protein n=1 Tax=Sporofaciens musculi TaxID=2681861 RepID=UPI0025704D50|nr:tetratricopeptide repeat protein [Sporofaciens musculi]